MPAISASVGRGGRNLSPDVTIVQNLLIGAGINPGRPDGICGNRTITAIINYQQRFLVNPDGRIDPGGQTLARLNRAAPGTGPLPPVTTPAGTPPGDWSGDSARWPQAKKLQSLDPGFRVKVEQMVAALAQRGFQPRIFYGWRSVAVQQQLYAMGRSKVRFSFHNAQRPDGTPNAWAVDVIDQRWGWQEPDCMPFFNALGEEANSRGLVWGGDWVSFRDWAHVQGRQNSELATVRRESGL